MLVALHQALHKHSVISCAIAKGGALRERWNVRTSGGSISLVGNGIAYNVLGLCVRWGFPALKLI